MCVVRSLASRIVEAPSHALHFPMSIQARIRQFVVVSGIETLGVALAGISGLLIVNLMAKDQYAIYTFFLACTTLVSGISEVGLAHCAMPVVGTRAGEPRWVVAVMHQIFRLRWLLLAVGVVLVVPYGIYSAEGHGWTRWPQVTAALVIVLCVTLSLRDQYLHTVLLLLGHIATLNRAAITSYAVRFVLVALVLLLPMDDFGVAALFVAAAAATAVSIRVQARAWTRLGLEDARLDEPERRWVDGELRRIATPLVPSALFFHVQGVVTVFIVSWFGTTAMMAEVGALGRLAMILVVLDRVTSMLLFPALARAETGPRFLRLVLRVHAAYLVLMLLIFCSAVFMPGAWMLLLGQQYAEQTPYLWMAVGSAILMNAAAFAFRTLAGRGATARQWITIPLVLALQAAFVFGVGVDTLPLVLAFNLATAALHFVYQYGLMMLRLPQWRQPPLEKVNAPLPEQQTAS